MSCVVCRDTAPALKIPHAESNFAPHGSGLSERARRQGERGFALQEVAQAAEHLKRTVEHTGGKRQGCLTDDLRAWCPGDWTPVRKT